MKTVNNITHNQAKKNSIEYLISASLKDFDVECIHAFRLKIKKMKAAMQLIDTVNKSFKSSKKYKIIQPFYKKMGQIREIQIQLSKFEAYQHVEKVAFQEKFNQILEKELFIYQELTACNMDELDVKYLQKVEKKLDKSLSALSPSDLKKYFKIRIQQLLKAINKLDFSKKKMHDLRKLIKEIKFNISIKKKVAAKYLSKNNMDATLLDNLQHWLGEWNDNAILKQKLREQKPLLLLQNGENEAFMQFKTSIEVENNVIKDKIKRALKMDY